MGQSPMATSTAKGSSFACCSTLKDCAKKRSARYSGQGTPAKNWDGFRSTLYRLRAALSRTAWPLTPDGITSNREIDYWLELKTLKSCWSQAAGAESTVEERIPLEQPWRCTRATIWRASMPTVGVAEAGTATGASHGGAWRHWPGVCGPRRAARRHRAVQCMLSAGSIPRLGASGVDGCYYRQNDRAAAIRQYQICIRSCGTS